MSKEWERRRSEACIPFVNEKFETDGTENGTLLLSNCGCKREGPVCC